MGMEIDDSHGRLEAIKLAEAQYQASGTIYGSNDPVEILNAIVSFTGLSFASVHLGLIDEEDDPNTLQILAYGDASGFRAVRIPARLQDYPAYETLAAVEVLNIEDVNTDPFLTDGERQNLVKQNLGAMLVIPLAIGQRLTGLIVFGYPKAMRFSTALLRSVRSLADQIAVVFENQSLLRRTGSSLDEVRALYDINRAMLSALDPLDVLRLLHTSLSPDSSAVLHVSIERATDSSAEVASFRHIITSNNEKSLDQPIRGLRKSTDLFDRREITSVDFYERLDLTKQSLLNQIVLLNQMTEGYTAFSAVMIVVRERGIVEDVIVITFPQERTFNARVRRLFEAVADQVTIVFQNQRLLRDAQKNAIQLARQVRVLQTLNQLSTGVSGFNTEKDLFDYAMQYMVAALGVDHAGVLMFDADVESGTIISEYPAQGSVGAKMEVRSNPTIMMLTQQPDRPVLIQNVEKSDLLPVKTREVLLKLGTYSLMILPLRLYGQLIGSIGFDVYERGRSFTPDTIEVAQTMVAQVSIALQNIRLFSDAQRRAEQLQQIATFGQAVQSTLNLEDVLRVLLSEIRKTISVDRLSVALMDEGAQRLRVVAQYDNERTYIDIEGGSLISMSGTLAGQVWETGEMLVIQDTVSSTGIRRVQDLSVRSLMIAPMRSRGRMIGTINVGCVRPYAYGDEDVAIFQQMLNQLVVSIENSITYAQSQRAAKNEALINDISIQLQMSNEIQGMMTAAVSELGKALGARRGRVRLNVNEG